jgi:hypothetical protein
VRILQPVGERPVAKRTANEVAAQRKHHRQHLGGSSPEQVVDEASCIDLLRQGVELLPLVDDEQKALRAGLLL